MSLIQDSRFVQPKTPEEATKRRKKLIEDIIAIKQKLSDGKKGICSPEVVDSISYQQWRTPLIQEMLNKEREALYLKQFITARTEQAPDTLKVCDHFRRGRHKVAEMKFEEPKTLAEAEGRRLALIAEVKHIQAQLADKNRTNAEGHRVGVEDYHQWRSRAIWAMQKIESEVAATNEWIKKRHQMIDGIELNGLDLTNPIDLLKGMRQLIKKHNLWSTLEPDEKILVKAVQTYLFSL